MKAKRVFWFSYHAPVWEAKAHYRKGAADYTDFIHQVRDGASMCELLPPLLKARYQYAGLLLNLPSRGFPPINGPKPESSPPLHANDLVIVVTRPPLSDGRKPKEKLVDRSETQLENTIIEVLKRCFFSHCSRSRVTLALGMRKAMSQVLAVDRVYKNVLFHQDGGAYVHEDWVTKHGLPHHTHGQTVGYLLYTPHLWRDGPALLMVFGLSGISTLFWTHLIRTQYGQLLAEVLKSLAPRLLLVRLDIPRMHVRPTSLAGFDGLTSPPTVLLDLQLPVRYFRQVMLPEMLPAKS